MSIPLKARGPNVTIDISASQAAMLAHEINWLLSRIQDCQEQEPECMLHVEEGTELWWLLRSTSIMVCEGASLTICPDTRTPNYSGYLNYAKPFHYIPKKEN